MKQLVFLVLFSTSISTMAQDPAAGRYTFVFLNTNEDRPELPKAQVDSLQAGHIANINKLVKAKKMIAAGPFYGGGGIFVFDTNPEETQALLDTDPAIAAGRFKLEVVPFNMDLGKICTLWHLPEEEVKMTTYYLVRYKNKFDRDGAYAAKTNRFTLTHLKKAERKFKEMNIYSSLMFDGNKGQVVIFEAPESDDYESFFAEHKLVENGIMDFYLKKIYFPKGVFCEK